MSYHFGYIEEKDALTRVLDAMQAAMEAAYATLLAPLNTGLSAPKDKVWAITAPATVDPPYGRIMQVTDGVSQALSDFNTKGKLAAVNVLHVSSDLNQVLAMAKALKQHLTTRAVTVPGFGVLSVASLVPDILRPDPDPATDLYLVDQRWGFFLRPTT